jgi:hypothetical protein
VGLFGGKGDRRAGGQFMIDIQAGQFYKVLHDRR